MKFCLLDADYGTEEGKPMVRLFGVDKEGKSALVLQELTSYFYALDKKGLKNKLEALMEVKKIEEVKKTLGLRKENFLKIFTGSPADVRDKIKHETECYEYSLNPYKRYLIDGEFYPLDWINAEGKETRGQGFDTVIEATSLKKLTGELPKLKIMAFDIEFIGGKIVMFSVADNSGHKEVFSSEEEGEILKKIQEVFQKNDPDIVVTYNGDQFDLDIVKQRSEANKTAVILSRDGSGTYFRKSGWNYAAKINGRVHIDLFSFVSRLMFQQLQSEVLTLNEVSQELLGKGKETHSLEQLEEMWKNDRGKMKKYCLNDSLLALKLFSKLSSQIFELSRISGQLPFDCSRMTFGALSEWYLVRKSAENNIIFPNPPHYHEVEKRRLKPPIKGAYVKEPLKGLHSNIAVFDFRSLYPSVIVSFNISPETLSAKLCKKYNKVPELGHRFCADMEGFVPKMVEEILKERSRIKNSMKTGASDSLKEQQFSLKILANATYGMFANPNARWYSYECAESSAAYGRHYIKQTIAEAEKNGFVVLYSDTDSLFIKMPDEKNVKTEAKKFLKNINSGLPGIMELDLQGFYKKGLFIPQKIGASIAKKRYALLDEKGNMTVRGMEAVRRDWCDLAKNLQREVLRLVLSEKEKQAVETVREVVKRIKARKIKLSEIAITTQLSRPLSEYKSKNPQYVLGKKLETEGKDVSEGTVLTYIITKGKGSISDRAEFLHKIGKHDYDADYYLYNQILPVALRVLAPLGYKETDFTANGLKKFG